MRWDRPRKKRPDDFRSSDLIRVSCDHRSAFPRREQATKFAKLFASANSLVMRATTFKRFIIIIKRLNRPAGKDERQRTAMNENRPRIDYRARSALRLYDFVRETTMPRRRDPGEIKARAGTVMDTEGIVFMINTDASCSLDDPY